MDFTLKKLIITAVAGLSVSWAALTGCNNSANTNVVAVSENTVSENTVSENEVTKEIVPEEPEVQLVYETRLLRQVTYFGDNKAFYYEYRYDDNAQLIGADYYNTDDALERSEDYEWNEEGYKSKITGQTLDGGTYSNVYDYDEYGNCILDVETWEDGSEHEFKHGYTYNVDGLVTKETSYDADGNVSASETIEYNEAGLDVKHSFYNNRGGLISTSINEYDENGLVVKYTNTNNDTRYTWSSESEYNDNGQVIKITFYNNVGNYSGETVLEYDEENRMIKETHYNTDSSIGVINEYEYGDVAIGAQ